MAGVIFDGNTVAPAILVEKEITKTKFGLTIDDLLPDIDENGATLGYGVGQGFVGAGIKIIGDSALYYKFAATTNSGVTSITDWTGVWDIVSLPDVVSINYSGCAGMCYSNQWVRAFHMDSIEEISGQSACNSMFYNAWRLATVSTKSLKRITGQNACASMYYGCQVLENTGLENLEEISGLNACQRMYSGCKALPDMGLRNLTRVDGDSSAVSEMFGNCTGLTDGTLENLVGKYLQGMFYYCTGLKKGYYPMLTDVNTATFQGITTSSRTFYGCSGITELHFRADTQAKIEAAKGYANKFGATNATIYFDLIGTITVGGVAYARDEKQSIRVDGTKTFVGWKDADGNVVYTSYADNAEPAVGTVVYSDAGTTQVGTVEGVA